MSEIAGKIATQAGAFMLEKPLGGRGILLGGVPGVAAATVMIIGGGVVGMNAAFIAIGMEAEVFVFDNSIDRLRELDIALSGRCSTVYSSTLAIEEMLPRADLVIGAVLVHGARAPRVVKREQLKLMKRGAVLVDVSIDQGGCFETSRPTTHSDPTYEVDGVHRTTASRTCRAPCRSPRPTRSPTRRCPTCCARRPRRRGRDRARPRPAPRRQRRGRRRSRNPAVADSLGLPLTPLDEALALRTRPPTHLTTHSTGGDTMATAAQTRTEIQNFIDGESRAPAETAPASRSSTPPPASRSRPSPLSGEQDVDAAVQAAKRAFDEWSRPRRASARSRCCGSPTRSRSTPRSCRSWSR